MVQSDFTVIFSFVMNSHEFFSWPSLLVLATQEFDALSWSSLNILVFSPSQNAHSNSGRCRIAGTPLPGLGICGLCDIKIQIAFACMSRMDANNSVSKFILFTSNTFLHRGKKMCCIFYFYYSFVWKHGMDFCSQQNDVVVDPNWFSFPNRKLMGWSAC